ncbi:MAG: tyrosine-type recombinase/integrase [Candidatus Caldatribacteriota bacterium]
MALKLPKVLSREDVEKMLKVPNVKCPTGLRNRVALQVMYRAGLRVSEVVNLSIDDLDLKKGYIYVQQGKNSKDRYVPIDEETATWLKRWLEIKPESEYLFCTLSGGKLSDRYLREVCYRISEKAGVYVNDNHKKKKVNPHVLRHTYATELLEEGFNIREVQQVLGHENLNTTMIYTAVRPESLAMKIKRRGQDMCGILH